MAHTYSDANHRRNKRANVWPLTQLAREKQKKSVYTSLAGQTLFSAALDVLHHQHAVVPGLVYKVHELYYTLRQEISSM